MDNIVWKTSCCLGTSINFSHLNNNPVMDDVKVKYLCNIGGDTFAEYNVTFRTYLLVIARLQLYFHLIQISLGSPQIRLGIPPDKPRSP